MCEKCSPSLSTAIPLVASRYHFVDLEGHRQNVLIVFRAAKWGKKTKKNLQRLAGNQKSQKAAVATQSSCFTGETLYSALLCE